MIWGLIAMIFVLIYINRREREKTEIISKGFSQLLKNNDSLRSELNNKYYIELLCREAEKNLEEENGNS